MDEPEHWHWPPFAAEWEHNPHVDPWPHRPRECYLPCLLGWCQRPFAAKVNNWPGNWMEKRSKYYSDSGCIQIYSILRFGIKGNNKLIRMNFSEACFRIQKQLLFKIFTKFTLIFWCQIFEIAGSHSKFARKYLSIFNWKEECKSLKYTVFKTKNEDHTIVLKIEPNSKFDIIII